MSNLIAKYTSRSSGLFPNFNDGYVYTSEEIEKDGIYTVEIFSDDDFTSCSFRAKSDLLTIEYLKFTNKVTTMLDMFYMCSSLTHIYGANDWNTSNVQTIRGIFGHCNSLKELNAKSWNIRLADSACWLFENCYALEYLDISNWNTQNIKETNNMFQNCNKLKSLDLSNWDTGKITNMFEMFINCHSLESVGNLNNWDTSNVTNMQHMFAHCHSLKTLNISNWDVNNVERMQCMFGNCESLEELDLSGWNPVKATSLGWMFQHCYKLKVLDIGDWFLSDNTNLQDIFTQTLNIINITISDADAFNKLINKLPEKTDGTLGVIAIKDATGIDESLLNSKNWSSVEGDSVLRYKFDTTKTPDLLPIFNTSFNNYNIIDHDTEQSNIIERSIYSRNIPSTISFNGCSDSLISVEYCKTDNISDMSYMFYNCNRLQYVNASNWYTGNVTSMSNMFYNCNQLYAVDTSIWDTSNVTSMNNMFYNCNMLSHVNVGNWKTSNVTDMSYMFYKCCVLDSLDGLEEWDVSEVINMMGMFDCVCDNITTLNLSSWNISNVTNMSAMLRNNDSLLELNISNWILNSDIELSGIFDNTKNITKLTMRNSNYVSVNKMIDVIPDMTGRAQSKLNLNGLENKNQIDVSKANERNWEVIFDRQLITRYKFDVSKNDNVIPIFNEEFNDYEIEDANLDIDNINGSIASNIITRSIYSVDLPTKMKFTAHYMDLLTVEFCNTSEITDMSFMFDMCSSLIQVKCHDWDTSKVTDMTRLFGNCNSIINLDGIGNWDMTNVINIENMFENINGAIDTFDLNNWQLNMYIDIGNLFNGVANISKINMINSDKYTIDKIIDILPMKSPTNTGVILISDNNIDDQIVRNANDKYWYIHVPLLIAKYKFNKSIYNNLIPEFNVDFIDYDIIDVYDNNAIDESSIVTRSIYNDVLPSKIIYGTESENDKSSSLLEILYLNTESITTMGHMFDNCINMYSCNTVDWNTRQVTDMSFMFTNCVSLTKIMIDHLYIDNVQHMSYLFANTRLTNIELNNWDLNNVINCDGMFSGMSEISTLKLNGLNINPNANVTNILYNNNNLDYIDLTGLNINIIYNILNMLPRKTSRNRGTLMILNNKDLAQIDMTILDDKYWKCDNQMYDNIISPGTNCFINGFSGSNKSSTDLHSKNSKGCY